jgi:arabinogalactan endo-1,4-beta-galactosidase
LDLSQANQKEKADAYIQQYLQKKLALRANGVSYKMDFVGYEVQKESTWSYFEIKQVKQLKQLNVFCEILFGVDPNQINIIHVNSGGQRKSYELATPKNTTQFNF